MSEPRITSQPPERMQKFARFFRGYMGAAPIIAAALPIPVTAGKIIPTYHEHTSSLTAYSSMFCFLTVAFVFYRRHRLGAYLLPELWEKRSRIVGRFMVSWLPLVLVLFTAASIILYHAALYGSLAGQTFPADYTLANMLEKGNIRRWPFEFQAVLFASYFGIFVFSTLAFSLMAVREYMQSELGLTELDLVLRSGDPNARPIRAQKANPALQETRDETTRP
jgi:hypothetical protein